VSGRLFQFWRAFLTEQIQSAARAREAHLLWRLSHCVELRLLTAAMLITSAFVGNCSAQQPTDLDKLVAPIADAISRSGKHKVVVLPVYNPDGKSSELGAWLAKQVSARLADKVLGLELIDTTSWPFPNQTGADSGTASKHSGQVKEFEKKAGVEIVVSGSFSVLENGLGISLEAHPFGKDKLLGSIRGLLAITPEMPPAPKETLSEQSGEKISRAGVGGVGIPRCIRCPDPRYPYNERSANTNGMAVLKLVVGVDGRVIKIDVVRATSPAFAESAIEAMKNARFKPALGPEGKPVRVMVNYEVTFVLGR
jgi:TonB family protein